MARQTAQVQRAILQMKAAGFARNDFSCTVEGNGRTGYGDANVFVKNSAARKTIGDRIPAICATGLGVVAVIFDYKGERRADYTISARYDMQGKQATLDYIDRDENGLAACTQVQYEYDVERFESQIKYY